MRTQRARHTRGRTRLLAVLVVLGGLWSGGVMWVWMQAALLLSARAPFGLSLGVARSAMWRMIGTGTWGDRRARIGPRSAASCRVAWHSSPPPYYSQP